MGRLAWRFFKSRPFRSAFKWLEWAARVVETAVSVVLPHVCLSPPPTPRLLHLLYRIHAAPGLSTAFIYMLLQRWEIQILLNKRAQTENDLNAMNEFYHCT